MKSGIRSSADARIVFDGQSHNRWPPAELPPGTPWADGIGPYPNRLMRLVHATGAVIPWHNAAEGGHGWGDLALDAATRLHPQARNLVDCLDILIMSGGQGDIYNDFCTGAQVYDRAVAYAEAARAAGFDLVLATTMPAFGPGGSIDPTPDMLQARIDHNTLLMADAEGAFDVVIDWHTHPVLADATDLTWWEADRVHMKPATADLAASLVAPAIGL